MYLQKKGGMGGMFIGRGGGGCGYLLPIYFKNSAIVYLPSEEGKGIYSN